MSYVQDYTWLDFSSAQTASQLDNQVNIKIIAYQFMRVAATGDCIIPLSKSDLFILYTVCSFYVYASALHFSITVKMRHSAVLFSSLFSSININIPHFIALCFLYCEPLCCMF